jgi:hypothetical protein
MDELIDKLASRHIAKVLTRLGDTIAPVVESEIKREMRFFAEDVKTLTHTEISNHEETQEEYQTRGNC